MLIKVQFPYRWEMITGNFYFHKQFEFHVYCYRGLSWGLNVLA